MNSIYIFEKNHYSYSTQVLILLRQQLFFKKDHFPPHEKKINTTLLIPRFHSIITFPLLSAKKSITVYHIQISPSFLQKLSSNKKKKKTYHVLR